MSSQCSSVSESIPQVALRIVTFSMLAAPQVRLRITAKKVSSMPDALYVILYIFQTSHFTSTTTIPQPYYGPFSGPLK